MLSRSYRLDKKRFNAVLNSGKTAHTPLFIARTLAVPGEKPRLAAVAPNKSFKTAVLRNKTRRKIYESVRPLAAQIKGPIHIILIAKPAVAKTASSDIAADAKSFFVKAGVLR